VAGAEDGAAVALPGIVVANPVAAMAVIARTSAAFTPLLWITSTAL